MPSSSPARHPPRASRTSSSSFAARGQAAHGISAETRRGRGLRPRWRDPRLHLGAVAVPRQQRTRANPTGLRSAPGSRRSVQRGVERVYAPAVEVDGHLGRTTASASSPTTSSASAWTHYLTYHAARRKVDARANEVHPEPAWVLKKLQALACYRSADRDGIGTGAQRTSFADPRQGSMHVRSSGQPRCRQSSSREATSISIASSSSSRCSTTSSCGTTRAAEAPTNTCTAATSAVSSPATSSSTCRTTTVLVPIKELPRPIPPGRAPVQHAPGARPAFNYANFSLIGFGCDLPVARPNAFKAFERYQPRWSPAATRGVPGAVPTSSSRRSHPSGASQARATEEPALERADDNRSHRFGEADFQRKPAARPREGAPDQGRERIRP